MKRCRLKQITSKDARNWTIYGFGCALHHTAYCLVNAYALQRTLIFTNIKWWHPIYNWTNIFYPISDTCTRIKNRKVSTYEIHKSNASTVYLPVYRDHGHNNPPAFPYHIPKDLAQRMIRLNGDPYSWWIGQILKYIIRLQRLDVITEIIEKTQFKSPIVGVHIRRTDKIVVEAKAYDIEEYMFHVEDYYKKLELTSIVDQRRVYLATDNTSVMQEAIKKYPQYTFYGDYFKAEMAKLSSRYTTEALSGFLVDLYILSQCDHVVCTFSSNVGRMAYELMQADRLDAVTRVTSLDHLYYFTTDEQRYRIAVMRHKNMSLEIGDIIDYKTCNKTSLGTNTRTGQIGRIPWYKTEEHIIQKNYPEYKKIPIL